MYVLMSVEEDMLITANSSAPLEEIALSTYEESVLEWFNLYSESQYGIWKSQSALIEKAINVAKENYDIKIIKLPEPIGD